MKLVQGKGFNDIKDTSQHTKVYQTWKDMLRRCYSEKFHLVQPTYIGCTVCEDWLTFSNFKAWMEAQDWEGKQLDKDLLVIGNKVYSPETCVFLDSKVNSFMSDCGSKRGKYPIGVSLHKPNGKYLSQCNINGQKFNLGYYDDPQEAHKAWLSKKIELAYDLASKQTNPIIAKGIIEKIRKSFTLGSF